MILDKNLLLSGAVSAGGAFTGQLVTATGNTTSTNVLDTAPLALGGNQAADIGAGEVLEIVISILQTLTSAGAATVQFQFVQADDAAISSNVQVLAESAAYGFAALTAGKQVVIDFPRATPFAPKRYKALRYVIGTAVLTNAVGQFGCAIVKNVGDIDNRNYNSGFTVQ